mgnify:CR=1 FL=1
MGRAMKKTGKQLFVVSLLCWGSLAQAQLKTNDITTANTLFTDYACTGCHDFTDTLVGPSLQQVAQRYKGKKSSQSQKKGVNCKVLEPLLDRCILLLRKAVASIGDSAVNIPRFSIL